MNKATIIQYFQNFFSDYCVCEEMIFELLEIIAGSGIEKNFFKDLSMKLQMLLQLGARAVEHKEFEAIDGGIFSMHLDGRGFNIRILYSFMPDRRPVLLLAFYERGGKRKTDYTPHISPAKERFRRKKEEY